MIRYVLEERGLTDKNPIRVRFAASFVLESAAYRSRTPEASGAMDTAILLKRIEMGAVPRGGPRTILATLHIAGSGKIMNRKTDEHRRIAAFMGHPRQLVAVPIFAFIYEVVEWR